MLHSLCEMSDGPNLVPSRQVLPAQMDGQDGPGTSHHGPWSLWLERSWCCCYLQLTYLGLLRSCQTIAAPHVYPDVTTGLKYLLQQWVENHRTLKNIFSL